MTNDAWWSRSRAVDVDDIRWDDVPRTPLRPATVRALRYMQDVEAHTIVYLRQLLATRAIDEPAVATFLATWFYEETAHGRALDRFLRAAGYAPAARVRSHAPPIHRLQERAMAALSRTWPDFVAVHMTWGAINELTALAAYQRLAALADHPVLTALLARLVRDEARHYAFYARQASRRLAAPAARRITRVLVDRFWAPVGSGVQADAEVRALADFLFGGPEGHAAARRIDAALGRLPGFDDARVVERWLDRAHVSPAAPPIALVPAG
ncbi:MAG: acyl-ACP desaturase [bacterium]|nr:acyl-ACP desaturase [bacterium]